MKTNGNNNGNGNHLRQASRIPQYDGQYVLPFAVQEAFAARLTRLKAEGRLPTLSDVLSCAQAALPQNLSK